MDQIKEIVSRALRGAKGYTQEEEAIRINVHRTVISRAENGHIPDDLFSDIIEACGGTPFIDRLTDLLNAAKHWHEARQHVGPLLYA